MNPAPSPIFRPLHDRILIKRLEPEGVTLGGIIIPDTAKEKPVEGIVIAVGAGNRNMAGERIPLEVRVDNRVLFSKYSGTEVQILGETCVIVREEDVLAVLGQE